MSTSAELTEAEIKIFIFSNVRTTQIGHGTERRPELIDDKNLFLNFVFGKILSIFVDGPDFLPTNYTP